jgi:tRNA pseudouridine55 synthase
MDGVINIYKPKGITSFDVVSQIRKISGTKKVGHAGTLDPAASGVLPVCLGRATKIIDYIMNGVKTYRVILKLGMITDTYDSEGKILQVNEVNLGEEEVINTIKEFIGEIEQIPPMYSALKVNGKRLYELAREGIEIERKPRKICIYDTQINYIKLPLVSFDVVCSKGTYIRSLCYDIGTKLGCGGMMHSLERISTGSFNINEAVNLKDLNEENIFSYLIPIDKALGSFGEYIAEDKLVKLLINGVGVKDKNLIENIQEDRMIRVYNYKKQLIGLGMKKKGVFKIINLLV